MAVGKGLLELHPCGLLGVGEKASEKEEGCLRAVLECIDLVSSEDEEANSSSYVHAGGLDKHLPKQIPFTILSGDKSFLELENQLKMSQRSTRILNPHHIQGDTMCALINSISDTAKARK